MDLMANVILIHGSYSNPESNWFSWIKSKLEALGQEVFVPKFPTPENQSFDSWMSAFAEFKQHINEETIIVAHSLGSPFALSVLEELGVKIKATFLVAGFTGSIGKSELDEMNKTIAARDFDFDKIKANCKKFVLYVSDNDPYIPFENQKHLASNLGIELKIIKGAGHFVEDSGYKEFEMLLEDIKSTI